ARFAMTSESGCSSGIDLKNTDRRVAGVVIERTKEKGLVHPTVLEAVPPTRGAAVRHVAPDENQAIEDIPERVDELPVLRRRHPVEVVLRLDVPPQMQTAFQRRDRAQVDDPSPAFGSNRIPT